MKDKNTTKKDLHNLKNSVEVPIIAHSHEMVIPVAYVSTVKKYLDQKGIKLPLTQNKLHELQADAKGYAKGGVIQTNKQSQKVIVNIHPEKKAKRRRKKTAKKLVGILDSNHGQASNPLWNSLTPSFSGSSYAAIRPMIGPSFSENLLNKVETKAEYESKLKNERETVEKYKKELEEKTGDIVRLIAEADAKMAKEKAPLIEDDVLKIDDKDEPELVDEPEEEYEGWDYVFTFKKSKKKFKIYAQGRDSKIKGLSQSGKWISYETLINSNIQKKQDANIKTIADHMIAKYG